MPAKVRPDITLRRVMGNIERLRYERCISTEKLAAAMMINKRTFQLRLNNPENLKLTEVIRAAKFLDVDVKELF